MRCLSLAGLGLAAVVTAAVSAQTSQQLPTFRSGVDVIEIDVGVVDGDGRPIIDLDPSEFTVSIDREVRRVVQAQYVSLRPPVGEVASPPEPQDVFYSSNTAQPRGRVIVIAVDEESMLFGEGRHVMRAAGVFVDNLSPLDRVALMAIPTGRYIDFTSDHERVRREIDSMAGIGDRVMRSINIGLYEAFQISEYRDSDMEEEVIARECGGGASSTNTLDASCSFRVIQESRSIVQEIRYHATNTRNGLESILRALSDYEGPKALVWISGGFVIGREASFLREIEDLAAAARTTVYVMKVDEPQIDTSEGQRAPSPTQDARMREAGLQAVTAITRGDIFHARYNPGPLFDRLDRELSGYYLLGVEARPDDRDEERRTIKVSVSRDGARVRARREVQFTELHEGESSDERLARTLRSPVVTTELPVRVATYTYPDSGQMRVLVATEVGGEVDLTSDVTLAYALRDEEGTVLASGRQAVTATTADTPGGPVLEYSRWMRVDPGTYSLRVAVLDGAGRRGSVYHPLHVGALPDGPVAVGDLLVADTPEGPGAFYPPVEARVVSGLLSVYTELYGEAASSLEEAHVVMEVASDALGAAQASVDAVLGRIAGTPLRVVRAEVPVDHLPPGRYVVRARVLSDSAEVARRHRPFQITGSP